MLPRRSLPLELLGAGLLGALSGGLRARTPEALGAKLDAALRRLVGGGSTPGIVALIPVARTADLRRRRGRARARRVARCRSASTPCSATPR
jgi:hypothetical protein